MLRTIAFVSTLLLAGLTLAVPGPARAQDDGAPATPPSTLDLDAADRPQEEKERDRWSKPVETLTWAGIEPGDVVVDFHAGSGYATWILSRWVGPEGVVFAEMAGRGAGALRERIESGDLAEVGNVVFAGGIDELPSDSLDVFYVVRNYHDYGADEVGGFLDHVARTLKPGGSFVVIDAVASEGRDEEGHRIAADVVVAEVTGAGFELVDSSDLLANPDDDHQGPAWDRRNQLDHFALKFRWPGTGGR